MTSLVVMSSNQQSQNFLNLVHPDHMLSGGTILEYLSEMNILGDMVVQWIEALRQEGPGLLTKISLCVIERCVCVL